MESRFERRNSQFVQTSQLPAASHQPEAKGEGPRAKGSRWLALGLVLALILAACGDDTPAATTAPAEGAFPVVVRGTDIPEQPERIVSLSATHTEVLYAIGAGDGIVATDVFSDFPAEAQTTEKIDAFNLSVEAVAALDPDLVILSYDPGDAMTGLEALGIPAILFAPPGPTDLDAVYAEWLDLGRATGLSTEATALVREVEAEIDTILAGVPQTIRSFTYFVELDSTLFTVGPDSLLATLFGLVGMTNVVGEDAGAFPQVSTEFLLDADPDFVFLADTVCCGQTAETVAERPGWDALSAVRNGNVVELDDSVASRWGPRLVELLETIVAEVYGAE